MPEKHVENLVLSPEVLPTISPETGLNEALELISLNLKENGFDFAVVSGKHGQEGVVSMADIAGAVRPGAIGDSYYRGWHLPGYWSVPVYGEGIFTSKCRAALEKKVKDIMQPLKYDLHPDDTLAKAADLFYKKKVKWLTVGEKGCFLGVIGIDALIQEIKKTWEEKGARDEAVYHGVVI